MWGVIFTIVSILLTVGELIIVKEKYQGGVALTCVIINFLAVFGTILNGDTTERFGLGIIITWMGLFCILWLWVKIEELVKNAKKNIGIEEGIK